MVVSLLLKIEASLEARINASNAPWMEAYMKNHFIFLGIKKPILNLIFNSYKAEIKKLNHNAFWELIEGLWEKPQREYHYFALEALQTYKKKLQKEDIQRLEWLICNHSWWDSVDMLATHMAGAYFQLYPDQISIYIERWIESKNIWLIRTSILFQLKYKNTTNVELLFDICKRFNHSKEFFIQKAIGWALRAYGDVEPKVVLQFVKNTELKPLSKREAIRKIKE
jgi:3-methyladenine DNA glycosylase AlkD